MAVPASNNVNDGGTFGMNAKREAKDLAIARKIGAKII